MSFKKYKLTTISTFEEDLIKITDYIAYQLNNPPAALELAEDIYQAINDRLYNPLSFEPYVPKGSKVKYYRIRVKNYIVFYVVIVDEMELRRIVYNKRDINPFL